MPIKFQISLTTLIRYAKAMVAILMTFGIIWIIYFLFQNLYLPLTTATEVAELKANVSLVTVNKRDLDEVIKLLDKNRMAPATNWDTINDPFALIHSPSLRPALENLVSSEINDQ